jgi:hypothetical protein
MRHILVTSPLKFVAQALKYVSLVIRTVLRLTTSMIGQPPIRLPFWDSSVTMSQRRWLGRHFSKDVTYNRLVCYQRRPVTICLAPASVEPEILSHL